MAPARRWLDSRRAFLKASCSSIAGALASGWRTNVASALTIASNLPATVSASAVTRKTGVLEPPITGEPQFPAQDMYTVWDGAGGVTPKYSSFLLYLAWENHGVGDWTDANNVAQGSSLFGSTAAPTVGRYHDVAMTALARRLVAVNKGIYLKCIGNFGTIQYAGRKSANPPLLRVTTNSGTFDCPCLTSAWWAQSSPGSVQGGTMQAQFDTGGAHSIVRFDMSRVTGTVTNATLSLYVNASTGQGQGIGLLEANPKSFMMGAGSHAPVIGLAAEVGEANLQRHADVLMAGDFAGTTIKGNVVSIPKLFRAGAAASATNRSEVLPDPDAPGTVMFRSSFTPQPRGDTWRGGFSGTELLQKVDLKDPLRPALKPVPDDLYYRMYVYLENDWVNTADGNKMGITWDCRMGWWNDNAGGYWQNESGNGGSTGSGKKELRYISSIGANRYVYLGQMLRMETSAQPPTDNPLRDIKPWHGYNYDIPLWEAHPNGGYPAGIIYGGAGSGPNGKESKFWRGRWYCIEQHLKLNTIDLSSPDKLGNGRANPDGILETWINGVLIDQRFDLRIRAHPEMGIAAVNANWYYGGVGGLDAPIHYRMNHLVVAKRYIGPRVKSSARSFALPQPGHIGSMGGNTLMDVVTDGAVPIEDAPKSLHLTKVLGSWGSAAVSLIKTGSAVADVWYYIMGGGHGDSGYDGLLVYKASTGLFHELLATTKWAPRPTPDPIHGEITPGRPDSQHIYDNIHGLDSGDSPLGPGFLQLRGSAVGQGAGVSLQSHFYSNAKGWARWAGLQKMGPVQSIAAMMKDTKRKRFVMYSSNNANDYQMAQYDTATPLWTYHLGAARPNLSGWGNDHYALGVYDPVRDLYIMGFTLIPAGYPMAVPAGTPGAPWSKLNHQGDIISAVRPGGNPEKKQDKRGWGNCWFHRAVTDTFIVMDGLPYEGYYEITPPRSPVNWTTDPWIWKYHKMSGVSQVDNYGGHSLIGRRFYYISEWDSLIVCPNPTAAMEIWKLHR